MIFRRNVSANVCQTIQAVKCTGADPGFFFLGGGALVSCSTSTPINHKVFFCRIPVVLEKRRTSRGGGAHSLHPPPRSAPDVVMQNSSKDYPLGQRFKLVHPMDRQKVEVLDFLTFYCNINYV